MNRHLIRVIPLAVMLAAFPAYAADDHGHADEPAAAHSHDADHANEANHFEFQKPATVTDAWAMLDEASAAANKAIEAKDAKSLHEAGEKLETAAGVLSEHPDAVAEENRQKLTTALEQLSKTVDRFHHAAEDNDLAGAAEALGLLDSQKMLVKSLYPKE